MDANENTVKSYIISTAISLFLATYLVPTLNDYLQGENSIGIYTQLIQFNALENNQENRSHLLFLLKNYKSNSDIKLCVNGHNSIAYLEGIYTSCPKENIFSINDNISEFASSLKYGSGSLKQIKLGKDSISSFVFDYSLPLNQSISGIYEFTYNLNGSKVPELNILTDVEMWIRVFFGFPLGMLALYICIASYSNSETRNELASNQTLQVNISS